ncbi:MAG: Hpt domain-containing protein [Planctomycetota bacterium]
MSDNGPKHPAHADRDPVEVGFSEAACLEGLGGDRALLGEIAAAFLAYGPTAMAAATDALDRGDADALARTAHTLKGSLTHFRADKPVAAALALERCARDGDLDAAAAALNTLRRQIDFLLAALAPLAAHTGRK